MGGAERVVEEEDEEAEAETGEEKVKKKRKPPEEKPTAKTEAEKRIDTIVLGCTHYPYVIPMIRKIVGPEIRIIDPAPAVARQVGRLLKIFPETAMYSQGSTLFYQSYRGVEKKP